MPVVRKFNTQRDNLQAVILTLSFIIVSDVISNCDRACRTITELNNSRPLQRFFFMYASALNDSDTCRYSARRCMHIDTKMRVIAYVWNSNFSDKILPQGWKLKAALSTPAPRRVVRARQLFITH